MGKFSSLPDAEINAKLAEKMGWTEYRRLFWKYPDKDNGIAKENWSPCTSRDDLAVVVGHIKDRGRSWDFHMALVDPSIEAGEKSFAVFVFTCPPRIIAEACLEVLEG